MRFFIVSVVCFLGAVQAMNLDEMKSKILEIQKACTAETGVDLSVAQKARNGEYLDDDKLKKQLFCFNRKAGFQNDAGELQVDFIKSKVLGVLQDEAMTDTVVSKCAVQKDTPEETAFEAVKCFHQFAPSKDFLN